MPHYEIFPLKLGEFQKMEKSTVVYCMGFGEKIVAPILAYLIRGNGKNILVDTGACDGEKASKNHHPMIRPPEMELKNALAARGVAPEEIDFVVVTHLHWDHCDNLDLFPGKKIYVQRREMEYAMCPYPIHYVAYETAELGLESPFLPYRAQFEYVEGDRDLLPGIRLMLLPGHSPGFQGVLVDTAKGKYLVASDLISSYLNWEGAGKQKHIVNGIHTDLSDYYASYAKVEQVADFVLPGHDARVLEHNVYPY